ncbi:MAG TPA: PLP-dependent aminotransferase family protein [Bryobacteraceae bacterium]|nr:PLP-dependent aminotransferase family protein [Bryobacteraceae bacterium]
MPLHRQIYEQWRSGILSGRFRRGERVPSTRELATTLAVSRSTVTESYEQLIAEGYLDTAHGSGTFVCHELPDEALRPGRARIAAKDEEPAIRLSRYGAGLREDFLYPPTPPGFIRFTHWRPDLERFPFGLWRKLVTRHLRDAMPDLFDYGEHSGGFTALRREIGAYVARSRAVSCTPEQVVVVNGSQQGLDLCVRLLLEPGDEVAFENPGYQGANRIFQAYGARLRPARIDADGVVIKDLGPKARLVYVTPSHQFPTGVSMSLARRLELIEWARAHGAAIIEDDYDSEYRYSGAPLPSLQGLARGVAVIYIGTFSKVMFPGLRIGYVIAPRQFVGPLKRAKWLADRQTSILDQAALTDFIREGHLERHIRRMRRLYGRRREVLVESLARHFGDRARVRGDAAGMHLMVRFEDGDIVERAAKAKVLLMSASAYYLTKPAPDEFIFGFSAIGERTIREGVKRLAAG